MQVVGFKLTTLWFRVECSYHDANSYFVCNYLNIVIYFIYERTLAFDFGSNAFVRFLGRAKIKRA